MAADDPMAFRPRSSGEILDDAWRLYRADAVALLVLTALFQAPALAALLVLLTRPPPQLLGSRFLLALTAALLLALTGLGSGACQELFRRRAAGEPVTLTGCLAASFRRAVGHLTARASGLLGILLGLGCLLLPGLTLWMGLTTLHAQLASSKTGSLGDAQPGREARFDPAKTAAVTLSRLPLLALAALNLVVMVQVGLWIAGNLAGLDVALLSYQLALSNPVFLTAAALLAWLLLTPYFEASSFLLCLDTRVRQEGLDLLFRVQRAFAGGAVKRAVGVFLALGLGLALATPERAAARGEALDRVRAVGKNLKEITREIDQATPYPGGQRWLPRLLKLADQLEQGEPAGSKRYRWFRRGLETFADRKQADAVAMLKSLDERLELVAEGLRSDSTVQVPLPSKNEIKGLLPPDSEETPDGVARKPRDKEPRKEDQPADKDKDGKEGAKDGPVRRRSETGLLSPVSGDLGQMGWWILSGLFLAVLAAALVLWLRNRTSGAAAKPRRGTKPEESAFSPPAPHEQTPADLYRQAEELARAARFKEAVRALYWAVLSLLHRQQMLRYETTRTNGEYVREVRLAPQAPPGLDEPFEQLTTLFDRIWYGDRDCGVAEYGACRELGDDIRVLVNT